MRRWYSFGVFAVAAMRAFNFSYRCQRVCLGGLFRICYPVDTAHHEGGQCKIGGAVAVFADFKKYRRGCAWVARCFLCVAVKKRDHFRVALDIARFLERRHVGRGIAYAI